MVMSDKNHVEDAVLAAYDRYAPSVSETTADRCALTFREGFLAGHVEAETELRAENKVLRLRGDTYLEQLQQKHAENERLREALEWVRDNTELWDAPVVLKALGT